MKKYKYSYFRNYILRIPSNPFNLDAFKKINMEDIKKKFLSDNMFQEAISLASKNLFDEATKTLNSEKIANDDKILEALLKYVLRMHTRCTPFGLFAGNTQLGDIVKGDSCISINSTKRLKKHVRIDSELLYAISKYLNSIDDIISKAKIFPNNTLYKIGDTLRYIEPVIESNQLNFIVNSLESDEYLEKVIDFCEEGVYVCDICRLLKDSGFKIEDIKTYVRELLDNQVLFSEVQLSSIETQPLNRLISITKKNETDCTYNLIRDMKEIAQYIKSYANDNKTNNYKIFYDNFLNSNSFIKQHMTSNLIQLDLQVLTQKNYVSEEIANSLLVGINILNKLSVYQEDKDLELFKSRFLERYEYNEVPLLKVLDAELGLGFPVANNKLQSPLIDDIKFERVESVSHEVKWDRIKTFFHKKISGFLLNSNSNEIEIELTDSDLKEFEPSDNYLPDTLSALVEIYMTDTGERIYIPGLSSPAANYFGRFASSDPDIRNYIKKTLYEKENEYIDNETVFAEISHFSDGRIGNILLRPAFTEHEIPILSTSLLPTKKQIKLEDIVVSINNNKLILRSLRLNKKIIPRLSSAHNYRRRENLSIYRFLCSIYNQNKKERMGIDWGVLASFPFLPRIIYKNLIFSKATWTIDSELLKPFYSLSDIKMIQAISDWRAKYRIPSNVVLKDFDNKLYVDFENATLVKLFFKIVKNRKQFTLEEFIFSEKNGFVFDKKKNMFTNEFIFSFFKNKYDDNIQ
ncbi:MAG: lantibiotic dehydratase [Bacteroidetes bacterium]|nr:lantibiotic dehydratase [Bacteroidota bacterium]